MKSEHKERKATFKETFCLFKRGFLLINKYCPSLHLSMALNSVVSAIIPYVTVFLSARIIDELAGLRRPEILWRWVIAAVVGAGVLALASAILKRWRWAKMYMLDEARQRINDDKLLTIDYAEMEKQTTNDLLAQIALNEEWMGLGIIKIPFIFERMIQAVVGIISAVALTVGLFLTRVPESAGALTVLDSPLSILILLLAIVLPTAIGPMMLSKAMEIEGSTTMSDMASLGNRIFHTFGFTTAELSRGLDTRLYNQHDIAGYYMRNNNIFNAGGEFEKMYLGPIGLLSSGASCMSALITGIVYVYVCLKAWAGAFGVGAVTQYISAVTALTGSVTGLLQELADMRRCVPYLRMTYEFLDIPNKMYQGSLTTEKRSDRQYDVEFRDVSFKYPGSENYALRHVSVKFKVGKRLAVVGENGSGKTTFIKLLCRLYDPQEGQILLNGIDIRKYNYRDYMDVFSVVFQDFQLLSQPLGANVAGSMNYDREKVIKSLVDAGFGERLSSMPDGLDTMLYREFDDGGVTVSGGEAQKIAIARALYKNAPFIVLDEPTATLDPIAEAEIYRQFNDISGDKTAIYISHRLSSCRFCDEILVFDEGRIVEQGSHDGLLAEAGKYHELWHAQAQYYNEKNQ